MATWSPRASCTPKASSCGAACTARRASHPLHKLGQTARAHRDYVEAERLVREALQQQMDIGNQQGVLECLAALGGLSMDVAQFERGVELLAATAAALAELGAPLAPADAADFAADVARGKSSLDPHTWMLAEQRGRKLELR